MTSYGYQHFSQCLLSHHIHPQVINSSSVLFSRHPFTGQMIPVSNGSGFIIREDGLILSNAHVVANKVKVVVQLKDGRRFDGDVQAVDAVSDLAAIKIKAVR